MDPDYYRPPTKEQLEKIVPKIKSETTTNIDSDGYVSADLRVVSHSVTLDEFLENTRDKSNDRKFAELEKRIAELEKQIKSMIQPGG